LTINAVKTVCVVGEIRARGKSVSSLSLALRLSSSAAEKIAGGRPIYLSGTETTPLVELARTDQDLIAREFAANEIG